MSREDIIVKVGQRIRDIREAKGKIITDLADKLGIEHNNLIRIEKGRTNPTLGALYRICHALEVKLTEITDVE